MKALTGAGLVLLVTALAACGGSETTTVVKEDTTKVEALQLEKEKAELEAEAAQLEAEKETQKAKQAVAKAKSSATPAPASETERESESETAETVAPPNVVGLPLPAAKQQLRAAGYTTAAVNTDTLFGIVKEDNYTICRQSPPRGDVVKVLAQKYGC